MPFSLMKSQRTKLRALRARMETDAAVIDVCFSTLLASIKTATRALDTSIDEHNKTRAELRALAAEIADEWRDVYDERSERWQDGDAGQAALAFVEEWEEVKDLRDVEHVRVLEPDGPHFGKGIQLPEESDT